MMSPEIDILKIVSTIIQQRLEHFEAFLKSHCSQPLISFLLVVIISSHSPLCSILNQPQSTIITHILHTFFSTLNYIIRLLLSCFTCFMFKLVQSRVCTFFIFRDTQHKVKIPIFSQCHAWNILHTIPNRPPCFQWV